MTIVEVIEDNSQAQQKGVKPDWKFYKLEGEEFSQKSLDAFISGKSDYTVTFLKDLPPSHLLKLLDPVRVC